jgi:thioredoxin 1
MKKTDNTLTNSSKFTKTKPHPFWRWFWLTFLVVSLGYAWYSFYVPSNDMVWTDTIVSAKKIASSSDKNIMVFFTGVWCSPCRIMKREVFGDKEVINVINAKVVKQYNIGATPTTIFIDPKGNVIDYAVGKVGKTKFLEMLNNPKGFSQQ